MFPQFTRIKIREREGLFSTIQTNNTAVKTDSKTRWRVARKALGPS